MRVVTTEAPQFWLCEECERKKLFSPTKTTDKEQIPEVLIQKNTRVLKSPNKSAFASRFNFKEKRVNTGRTKYISCDEAVKLSSGVNKSEQHPPSSRNNGFSCKHGSSRSMPPPHSIKSTKCSSVRVERTNTKSFSPRSEVLPPTKEEADIEVSKSSKKVEKTITQEITKMAKSEVLSPTKEEAEIEVPKSSKKVDETNMKRGGNKNDADVEAREVYLTMGGPGPVSEMHDTSIPALHSYWKYEKCTLTEFLWNKKLVMKSYVDEVELFVLSSKFLQLNSQEFEGNYFLWGVFRANMVKKDTSSNSIVVHQNQNENANDFPPGFEKMHNPPPPQG
ncbi:unnamed protein product [Lactuca virosa]|uniref:AIPP2-like SPOC-like domain-containing protein n=1 Tax=Lactuca virosa TaxID=75947 RepID=A0AAU9NYR5_9ASTR|nr:unnamed protein product [Lactuca virosa]